MEPRFQEPDGFTWGSFQNADGAKIRFGHAKPEGKINGTMVLVPGFREPIEKYFEVMRDMTSRGYEVWMMEWRGNGASDPYIKAEPQKPSSEGFDRDIRDLHKFMTEVVKPADDQKVILSAHSMGAHIGLRYLKEHPETFDAAITTAPMFDIITGLFPRPVARRMVNFAKTGRILGKYMPGGADWEPGKKKFEDNHLTSDPARWAVQETLMEQKPELRKGDATYGWLYHAFASIDVLNREDYLKEIKIPVLMAVCEADAVVDVKAQKRAASILPDCKPVTLAGALHEIWMERDDLRNQWLKEVDAFLEKHTGMQMKAANENSSKKPKPPSKRFAP